MRKLSLEEVGRNPRTPRWGRPAACVLATVPVSLRAAHQAAVSGNIGEVLEVGGRWGGLNFRITEWAVVRLRKIEQKYTRPPRRWPSNWSYQDPIPLRPSSHVPLTSCSH